MLAFSQTAVELSSNYHVSALHTCTIKQVMFAANYAVASVQLQVRQQNHFDQGDE